MKADERKRGAQFRLITLLGGIARVVAMWVLLIPLISLPSAAIAGSFGPTLAWSWLVLCVLSVMWFRHWPSND